MGSQFHDPYGALLDSDMHAVDISSAAISCSQPEALSLTATAKEDIVDAIAKSAVAFRQVLDLLYPMAWETPR